VSELLSLIRAAENSISSLAKTAGSNIRKVQIRLRREPSAAVAGIKTLSGVQMTEVQGDRVVVSFGGGDEVLEKICEACVNTKSGLLEVVEQSRGLEQAFIELTETGKEI
jgi:hypothetical protein